MLTVECQTLKSKRGRDAAAGKSSLCNHHDKGWIRQEFSSKVLPTGGLLVARGKINYTVDFFLVLLCLLVNQII